MKKSHHLFEELYENNKRLVYTFIRQAVDAKDLDNYLIDELFQVVWIKVYNNIEKFNPNIKRVNSSSTGSYYVTINELYKATQNHPQKQMAV